MFLFSDRKLKSWPFLSLVVAFGVGIRLLALTISTVTEGDSLARVYLAWDWLKQPEFILHGVWLPLQTYYLAPLLAATQEFYYTPILLNIVISAATAIPLYWFGRREFGERAGWITAIAFLLYPLAFRNSLMAMSDTPFTFFVAAALPLLSYARRKEGRPWQAAIAGLMMTFAAGIRFEAWILIPFMAVILWHRPKHLLSFLAFASIMPILWGVGSYWAFADPLFSFKYQAIDTAQTLSERGGMSVQKRLVRVAFFPGVLLFGLSMPICLLAIAGAYIALKKRLYQVIWLVPFIGLFMALAYKAIAGEMNLQPRYAIVLGIFLLPFSAFALTQIRANRKQTLATLLALGLMMPFSYILNLLNPLVQMALSDTKMVKKESPSTLLEGIPRLSASTLEVSDLVNRNLQLDTGGLVMLGFLDISHLVTFEAKINPDQVCLVEAYRIDNYQWRFNCYLFFDSHPEGVLAIHKANWPTSMLARSGSNLRLASGKQLQVTVLKETAEMVIYRYRLHP